MHAIGELKNWVIVELMFAFFLQDGNGKVSKPEYREWYKKVVEVDSDFEDDFEIADDADFKKKYEEKETQKKIFVDFKDFDQDGDGNITMNELITKLNPSAILLEKEELAAKKAIGNQKITFSGYFLSIYRKYFLT